MAKENLMKQAADLRASMKRDLEFSKALDDILEFSMKDWVNPMDTNGIETTTWHDQKPSHNPKPDNLIELEYKMEKAWLDYDHLIEKRYDWYAGITKDEVTHEMIDNQRAVAVHAQQAYFDAWRQANE